jgi:type 1 glutamine amidotransferase
MFGRLNVVAVVAVAWLCGAVVVAQIGAPRRVEVLFLGHAGAEHDSGRFAPMLKAALAQYGFNFSYTTDLADLNASNLAQYDALMIYGDHERLTSAQETAVLDFVVGGKGFLPIHAASASSRTSPAYAALVGGVFQPSTTAEFTTRFANTSHPVLQGLQPFSVSDDTAVVQTTPNLTDRARAASSTRRTATTRRSGAIPTFTA